jgi:hypothetical protein
MALAGRGLFLRDLVRNRWTTLKAQNSLRGLVETAPAAIVTVDEHGYTSHSACVSTAGSARRAFVKLLGRAGVRTHSQLARPALHPYRNLL